MFYLILLLCTLTWYSDLLSHFIVDSTETGNVILSIHIYGTLIVNVTVTLNVN